MRIIIAGGRDINDEVLLAKAIRASGWSNEFDVLVCGMARGVDSMARTLMKSCNIPIDECHADWERYGKRAGHIRNGIMAERADALIAIWDGKSPGTRDMIEQARAKGLKVYVHLVSRPT